MPERDPSLAMQREMLKPYRMPDDLDRAFLFAWDELCRAVRDRRHGFHLGVLATVQDGQPQARSLVLRRVDVGLRRLCSHTDVRSPKCVLLATPAPVAWVMYCPKRQLQVRLEGLGHVEHDTPLADEQWAASSLSSRRCYLAPHAPGMTQPVPDPNVPEQLRGRTPTQEESLAGRANFCVLVTRVRRLEMLELASQGHRRAAWEFDAMGKLTGQRWLSA